MPRTSHGRSCSARRPALLLLLLLVVPPVTIAQPEAPAAGETRRVVVLGDTGTGDNARRNVEGALAEGAYGIVGVGDYAYNDDARAWRSLHEPLTRNGSYLTLGNHDRFAEYWDLFPGFSRTWSANVSGVRVVGADTESRIDVGTTQYRRVRDALCNATEEVRILVMHKPWWLGTGARHPASEFPGSPAAMDALVSACGVDLVLTGHEHNYQRAVRNGTHYVIAGNGGQSLYPVRGAPPDTVVSFERYGRVLLDLAHDRWQAEFRTLDGVVLDAFPDRAAFDAAFLPRNGNEWWVQVRVDANQPLSGVDARVDGGAWRALEKKSWGDWAASFHVPPDALVQFRARATSGDIALSGHYRWPSAQLVAPPPEEDGEAAPPPPPPPPGGDLAATFRNARGNEWWLEVDVDANKTLARVDARVDDGSWLPLQKRSWGSWAASHHAPSGSLVRFRATASDGSEATSGAYRWPDATLVDGAAPPPPPPDDGEPAPAFAATFRNVRGNEWWLETDLDANKALAGVDARVDGGGWLPLQKRSWGSWAASHHAPSGSLVDFRARATSGEVALSGSYRWPDATPVG